MQWSPARVFFSRIKDLRRRAQRRHPEGAITFTGATIPDTIVAAGILSIGYSMINMHMTNLGLALSHPLRRLLQVKHPERVHGVLVCRLRAFLPDAVPGVPGDDRIQPVSDIVLMIYGGECRKVISPAIRYQNGSRPFPIGLNSRVCT